MTRIGGAGGVRGADEAQGAGEELAADAASGAADDAPAGAAASATRTARPRSVDAAATDLRSKLEAKLAVGPAPAHGKPFADVAAWKAGMDLRRELAWKDKDPVLAELTKAFPNLQVYLDDDTDVYHMVVPDQDKGAQHLSLKDGRLTLTLSGKDFWTHKGEASMPISPLKGADAASVKAFQAELATKIHRLEARIQRLDFDKPAPAGHAGHVKDLGEIDGSPGAKLKGKLETLKPGDTLRFTAIEPAKNGGLQGFTVDPPGALVVTRKTLSADPPGIAADEATSYVQYEITVPPGAKAGTKAKLTSAPFDHATAAWAFSFDVKVGKK